MLENIVKQEIIFYMMSVLVLLGVIAKMISTFSVGRMVRAASEIHKSNHRLMKLVKAKFEHASMISDKVQNVGAFVDKFLYEHKVWGVRLYRWKAVPKITLILTAIFGIFGIFESYRMEKMGALFFDYLQWTGLFVLFLALLCFVGDEASRIQATRTYMVEYLENVCIHRYERLHRSDNSKEETTEIVSKKAEPEDDIVHEETKEEATEENRVNLEINRNEQEMRIRAILEEFLA